MLNSASAHKKVLKYLQSERYISYHQKDRV
nr:MAG TPA: hypothetical protein [Caudoviricetes sp.]